MCDIWFTKYQNSNEGGYAQFMPVQATDDGIAETCTSRERFYLIKFPGIDKGRVSKYFEPHYGASVEAEAPEIARRRWVLRANDLPLAARQKFQQSGQVIVKAGTYQGEYDYTWNQVKSFFRDNLLSVDESAEL